MSEVERSPRVPGERGYRALLRCYPAEFREMFAEMMVDFYRDRIGEQSAHVAWPARVALRARLYAEVVIHGLAERLVPLRARNPVARNDTRYSSGDHQMLSNLRQDLRYALRRLRRSPSFAATVLLTLALGIAVNVAIFSVVNGVLIRPLPFSDADRLIQLTNGEYASTISEPEVVDLERDARAFSTLGVYSFADGNVTGGTEAERVRIARVSAGFFHTLAPTPHLGRFFVADEDKPGGADVVVVSYGLWQRRLGMDSSAIGKTIVLNDVPRVVIGVTPPNFDFPSEAVAVWTPLRLDRESLVSRNNHYLRLVARLAPGTSVAAADRQMRTIRDRWAVDYPANYKQSDPLRVDVTPIRDRVVGGARPYLVALLGAVGFVLLVACANIANLLLARGEARHKEMTIRSALGATRGRIAGQLALESGVLTIAGGALGVAAAWPVLRAVVAAAPGSIPRVGEIQLDTGVLLFAVTICVLTGLLFGLVPVVRGARVSPSTVLNSGARNAAQSAGRGARRMRTTVVVSEVAIAVMMLAGAGLFIRTLLDLQRTDLGFATDGLLTARLALPRPAYTGEKGAGFISKLTDRVQTMPGVERTAAMAWTPIIENGGNWGIQAEGAATAPPGDVPTAAPQQITPGFFATLEIPLFRGREFTRSDEARSEAVVIVNQALARRLWNTDDVLGRRMRLSSPNMPWLTVVGVVGDTRVEGIREPAPPVMYFPHAQAGATGYFTALSMTLVVKSSGAAGPLVAAIKQAVRELDPNVPISDVRAMREVVGSSIARHRFTTLLLSVLASLGLFLAAIGIYGVVAYGVAQRRYELGVRMALGADAMRVVALVLREGIGVALAGLAIGIAGVLALVRALGSMLTGIGAIDLTMLAGVSTLLLVVALVAVVVPARRATAVDPTEALRKG